MRQLLLDLDALLAPSLDTFEIGQNAELVQQLNLFARRLPSHSGVTSLYLWGASGCGKSHLLRALAEEPGARYLRPDAPADAFAYDEATRLYLLDDVHELDGRAQIDAFALFNEARARGAFFVAAGEAPPMLLTLREDLRTRLGWGLVYQLAALSDEDILAALEKAAHSRGLPVAPGVLSYLITHYERNMGALTDMLGRLDRYSRETKRAITLPLLREMLYAQTHTALPVRHP